jgi:hypothetical protein
MAYQEVPIDPAWRTRRQMFEALAEHHPVHVVANSTAQAAEVQRVLGQAEIDGRVRVTVDVDAYERRVPTPPPASPAPGASVSDGAGLGAT